MEVEDYFVMALVFAIVAFLSLLMRSNPFNMWLNSDTFPLGYTAPFQDAQHTSEIIMYNTTLSLFIFLPSAYFAIALTIGGIVKAFIRKVRKKIEPQKS